MLAEMAKALVGAIDRLQAPVVSKPVMAGASLDLQKP
jgi:hypothetical protein